MSRLHQRKPPIGARGAGSSMAVPDPQISKKVPSTPQWHENQQRALEFQQRSVAVKLQSAQANVNAETRRAVMFLKNLDKAKDEKRWHDLKLQRFKADIIVTEEPVAASVGTPPDEDDIASTEADPACTDSSADPSRRRSG